MTAEIRVNGEPETLDVASVDELLRAQGIDPEAKGVAVALNGAVVPRAQWTSTALGAGDEVEIVKPFRGG